jgi:GNAT superfamily N-acetyltransferase
MDLVTRMANANDAEQASRLVHASFRALAAHDWSPEATEAFRAGSTPDRLREKIAGAAYAAVAQSAEQTVGFLLMPSPAMLGMLFVHPAWSLRGIGRRLWEGARAHVEVEFPGIKTIELNATPFALSFYRSLGFAPISAPFVVNGARAIRMACWLPARALGAEPGRN